MVQPRSRPPAQGDQLSFFPAGWKSEAKLSPTLCGPHVHSHPPHTCTHMHRCTHTPHTGTHTSHTQVHTHHTQVHTHVGAHTYSAYLSAPLALCLTLHLQDFICEEIFI